MLSPGGAVVLRTYPISLFLELLEEPSMIGASYGSQYISSTALPSAVQRSSTSSVAFCVIDALFPLRMLSHLNRHHQPAGLQSTFCWQQRISLQNRCFWKMDSSWKTDISTTAGGGGSPSPRADSHLSTQAPPQPLCSHVPWACVWTAASYRSGFSSCRG